MSNSSYYNPADLANFGKITEWQPEMGRKFFEYYGEVLQVITNS